MYTGVHTLGTMLSPARPVLPGRHLCLLSCDQQVLLCRFVQPAALHWSIHLPSVKLLAALSLTYSNTKPNPLLHTRVVEYFKYTKYSSLSSHYLLKEEPFYNVNPSKS